MYARESVEIGANVDLSELRIGQPEELVTHAGTKLRGCTNVEDACSLFARELFDNCTVNGERSLVLSRIYLTVPYRRLTPANQDRLRAKRGAKIPPNERFLCLVGTHGTQPAWCDVRQSQGHAAIPLDAETIASAPMLSRLFEQMGVELSAEQRTESGIVVDGVGRSFGLFHVLHAKGSAFVPAQEEFVLPHGVESVLGCGTVLLDGAISIWIGFSRHVVGSDQAMPLLPMMPMLWQNIQSTYRRGAIFAS